MLKVTLRSCFNRLRELGQPPPSRSKSKRAYRTGFQRSTGAIAFVSAYFAMAYFMLDPDSGSEDNLGVWTLLFFAVIVAALGAFFAPRMAAFIFDNSIEGRRRQASRTHPSTPASSFQNRVNQDVSHAIDLKNFAEQKLQDSSSSSSRPQDRHPD